MFNNNEDYAPYFSNGLLYLPPRTVKLLIKTGLDKEVAASALKGLALDDDRELIGMMSNLLERVLEHVADNSEAFQQLNSPETQFMFTGKPARGEPALK